MACWMEEKVQPAAAEDQYDRYEDEEEEPIASDTSSIGVCSQEDDEEDKEEEEVQSKGIHHPHLHLHLEPPPSSTNSCRLVLDDDDDDRISSNHDTSTSTGTGDTNQSSLTSLDSLEDSLPFKKGLSNFYSGKSKSFTTLSNVAHATAKDLVKPDNPFNKRRRLLLACSRNRRASCSNLISIAESPLLPLPPVVSECDEEDDEEEEEEEEEDALVTPVMSRRMMRTRSDKEKNKRPSLFTVAVSRQVFTEYDNDPLPPLLTPNYSSITGSKMALRSPARSFSLSDLNQHSHAHHAYAPP